ncbi:carbohydrate ABC transporter substrate-binding protein (CUT1 family) [Micromonospora sp. Llam0]|uniref:ABC transporter substrate-binding protein n=1 Tax=Micromonospora sp. Llam0 TaxID=2485143 RepID=UPI000F487778|nr:ABC transporter substrate-binding protein [Micromonospora sp. Llam0]ROO51593.1 carbohydrate ABC transporter substrate-binding protein (CUT1 family) [Micromonospora sp. Llam0]
MHPATSPTANTPATRAHRTPFGRRRLLRGIAATAVVPLVLGTAACGDDAASSDPDAPVTIEFFWWGGESRAALTEQALDLYEDKNPNVTINPTWQAFTGYYDKLATISAGGNAPDIFQIDDNGLAEYAGRNVTLDLTPFVSSGDIDLSNHPESLTQYGQIDGKQVAVAAGENTPAMVYDKTKITELGLPVPETGWTYDEFVTWSAQVTEAAGDGYWGAMDPSADYKALWLWLRSQGKEFYDGPQLAFTEADLTEWFQFWLDAREAGATPPADVVHEAVGGGVSDQLVVTGKGATSFMWSNQLSELGKSTESELGMVAYPGDPKGQWARASLYWAGSRSTEHPEVVADVIDFLANDPEAAQILGVDRGLPSNLDNRETVQAGLDDPYMTATVEFENALIPQMGPAPAPPPQGHGPLRSTLTTVAESVTYGQASPADAAAEFFRQAEATLE